MRGPIDQWTLARLQRHGYSNEAFETCLARALDAYRDWHATIIDDIVDPFYRTSVGGTTPNVTWDFEFTKRMMRACVSALGARCLLDNQEIGTYTRSPPLPAPTPPANVRYLFALWEYVRQLREHGVLIAFQTASPGNLLHTWGSNAGGWNAAVGLAHHYGADSLELWPPEEATLSTPAPGGTPIPCHFLGHPEYIGYTYFPTSRLLRWSRTLGAGIR